MTGTIRAALVAAALCYAQQPPGSMERLFAEGERALAAGRYVEAEAAYEKLKQLSPGMAEVHGRLGLVYFQQGKFAQAVPALRQALKLKPSLPNTDILLAMSLSEMGHFRDALAGLEKGFRRSADPALKRMSGLQLQRAYTGLGRDDKAVETALEMSRLYPNDPEVLYHGARLFGNFAFLSMRKLNEVAPNSVWRHQAAGEAHESQGQYDLAITEYREALALDPSRPGLNFRIGRALLRRGEDARPEATQAFERELKLDPSNANAAYELGELLRKLGQTTQSIAHFEAAVSHAPDFEEALLGLSRVLIETGKPDDALPHLRKALALNPANDVTHYRLSQVHRALGNTAEQQKALAEFRRLRAQQSRNQQMLKTSDVTRQELEPEAGK